MLGLKCVPLLLPTRAGHIHSSHLPCRHTINANDILRDMQIPRGLLIYCLSVLSHLPVRHALGCRGVGPVDISLVDTFSQSLGMLFKSNRFACNKFVLTLKLIATTSNARVGASQKYSLGECCHALNSYTSLTLHGHPT